MGNMRITEEMVRNGLASGLIKVIDDDGKYGCLGVACRIGSNAFYFTQEADGMTASGYRAGVPFGGIAREIFLALDGDGGIRTEFADEYEYYRLVLAQGLC